VHALAKRAAPRSIIRTMSAAKREEEQREEDEGAAA
jgi:hypothetical protein